MLLGFRFNIMLIIYVHFPLLFEVVVRGLSFVIWPVPVAVVTGDGSVSGLQHLADVPCGGM